MAETIAKDVSIEGLERTIYKCDSAVLNYYTNYLKIQIESNGITEKVPVVWAIGERWKNIKNNKMLRDANGSLILPIISIGNTGIEDDPTKSTLSTLSKGERFTVKNEVISDTEKRGLEYVSTTIDYPKQLTLNYEVNIWAQTIAQMNRILEQIINKQEYTTSFVVYENDNKTGWRYNALIDSPLFNSMDNLKEVGQEERMVIKNYTFRITTPIIDKNSIKQERVAVKFKITESVE